jgi:hypothetical protein
VILTVAVQKKKLDELFPGPGLRKNAPKIMRQRFGAG